jgi:RNA polymerase sigma-70 factor (ECF subfamily)
MPPHNAAQGAERARALLSQAQAGSEAALGELLELYRNYLLSVAGKEMDRAIQAKAGPSDVVQDTFLEAQRLFARFEGQAAEQFLAWLRSILQFKLSEYYNRFHATQKRQVERERSLEESGPQGPLRERLPAEASTPSVRAMRQEEAQQLRAAVERLPELQRQVLIWHHWEGLTFAEIGRRVQRSEDAVRMIFGRALNRLAEEVEHENARRPGEPG